MIFFSKIFTIFEVGIISQQLGIKDTFLALGMGPYFGPKLGQKRTLDYQNSTYQTIHRISLFDLTFLLSCVVYLNT